MADKFVLGRSDKGIRQHIGHDHCKVCGACFTAGLTQDVHRCPAPVDMAILEVFLEDSNRVITRPGGTPKGFQEL